MSTGTRTDDFLVFETGTTQQPSEPRVLQVGTISATIDGGALRTVSSSGVEVIRQIDFPCRDQNWATFTETVTSESFAAHDDHVRYERHFDIDDGALSCRVVYDLHADGTLSATGEATANRPFTTARTGFTILHPITGVAGRPVTATSPSGVVTHPSMPDEISPAQPIKDIAGLLFDIDGVSIDLTFDGDVFEMEDQRNWSDTSFKTYCRPLALPSPYSIPSGTTIRQEVRATITGSPAPTQVRERSTVSVGPALTEPMPDLLLAIEDGWQPTTEHRAHLASIGLGSFLVRVTPSTGQTTLDGARAFLRSENATFDLEIVLDDDTPAADQVSVVASACHRLELEPDHVIALPRAFLKSHQPDGEWPRGLQPAEAVSAARVAFPGASIGAGMLTNFTEFNRCRPDTTNADYLTHGNSATVHAADDRSVLQTLETLPDIFRTARTIIGDQPYRLGLTAIGMRTNPYGENITDNPAQQRMTMTTWDPRARGLFGAAWAIGTLAATEGFGIEAIALASPAGPFGVLSTPGPVGRPWYDENPQALVYPIFHALRGVALMGGQRHQVVGLAPGLAGVAAVEDDRARLIIANVSDRSEEITLGVPGNVAVLDTNSFAESVTSTNWVDHTRSPMRSSTLTIDPLSVVFIDHELHGVVQ